MKGWSHYSSSRQTTPIHNPIQQGQIQNYGEQKSKQNVILTTRAKKSIQSRENNLVQIDNWEAGLQKEMLHSIRFIITRC